MDLGQPIRQSLKDSIKTNNSGLPSGNYFDKYQDIVGRHYSETYNNPDFNNIINDIIREDRNQLKELTWRAIWVSKDYIGIYDKDTIKKMIHCKIMQLFLENDDKFYEVTDESTNDAYSLTTFMVTTDIMTSFYIDCMENRVFLGNEFRNFVKNTIKVIEAYHEEDTGMMKFMKEVMRYVLERMESEFKYDKRV